MVLGWHMLLRAGSISRSLYGLLLFSGPKSTSSTPNRIIKARRLGLVEVVRKATSRKVQGPQSDPRTTKPLDNPHNLRKAASHSISPKMLQANNILMMTWASRPTNRMLGILKLTKKT